MARKYTANEIREAANAVDEVSINDNGEYFYEKHDKFNPFLVRDMLRQAADMMEKFEKKITILKQEIDAKKRHIEGLVTNVKNMTTHSNRLAMENFSLEKKLSAVKAVCETVKPPFSDDAMMPTPWESRVSKWGIRDIDIYDADGHHILQMNECYPPERMGSATVIPLAVNAVVELKRILCSDVRSASGRW